MRKVTLGSALLIAGMISAALLLAGAAPLGGASAFDSLSACGLLPLFCVFAGAAALGLLVALMGFFSHEYHSEGHSHRHED